MEEEEDGATRSNGGRKVGMLMHGACSLAGRALGSVEGVYGLIRPGAARASQRRARLSRSSQGATGPGPRGASERECGGAGGGVRER